MRELDLGHFRLGVGLQSGGGLRRFLACGELSRQIGDLLVQPGGGFVALRELGVQPADGSVAGGELLDPRRETIAIADGVGERRLGRCEPDPLVFRSPPSVLGGDGDRVLGELA